MAELLYEVDKGVKRFPDPRVTNVARTGKDGPVNSAEDLDAAVAFFAELGLILEGRMPIEGDEAGRVTGVRGQRVEIAILVGLAQQLGQQSPGSGVRCNNGGTR